MSQQITLTVTDIQNLGYNPFRLMAVIHSILTEHFSKPSNLFNQELKDKIWTPDDSTSTLVVEPGYKWNPKLVEKRPGIFINRGQVTGQRMQLSDRTYGATDKDIQFAIMVLIEYNLECIGRIPAEVDGLGWEVFMAFNVFKEVLKTKYRFHEIVIANITPMQKRDEFNLTNVPMGFAFEVAWTCEQIAPAVTQNIINYSS